MAEEKRAISAQEVASPQPTINIYVSKIIIVIAQEVYMNKKILILVLTTALLLSVLSVCSTAQTGDITVRFQIKSVGFDQNMNSYRLQVNISANTPGNVVYLEEYYTVDSERHPKYQTNSRTEAGDLVKTGSAYNTSFEILRPVPHGGKTYTLIKAIVILDGYRVLEYWLTKNNDFIDNTGTEDENPALSELQNIEKYETRENSLVIGKPVLFEYTSLDIISGINVTGTGSEYASLRVDLLKGRSASLAKPNGSVYKYFEISSDSDAVGEIAPKYKVDNSWMVNRSIPDTSIRLVSWDGAGKDWIELPTRIMDKDSQFTYFESTSQGGVSFAIIGFPLKNSSTANKTVPIQKSNSTVQMRNNAEKPDKEPLIRNIPGFEYISGAAALVLILIFRHFRREE